jgi:hypothetical protein
MKLSTMHTTLEEQVASLGALGGLEINRERVLYDTGHDGRMLATVPEEDGRFPSGNYDEVAAATPKLLRSVHSATQAVGG